MNKNKKSRRLLRFLPGIVLLTVLAAGVSVTAARYVSRKEQSGIIAPQEFYFTSDLLKEEAEDVKYFISIRIEQTSRCNCLITQMLKE